MLADAGRRLAGAIALLAAVALSVGLASGFSGGGFEPARLLAGDSPSGRAGERLAGPHGPDGPAGTPPADERGAPPRAREDGGGFSPVERALLREAERQDEQRLLQERLGGLAALAADPLPPELAACVPDDAPAVEGAADAAGVAEATARLRGLDFTERIPPEFLPPARMAARVEEAFAARDDPEALDVERRVLAALGAVPPDADMRRLRVEAFAEHVSGLFSGARDEVLVRVDEAGTLSPLERTVLAHEYEHALTFQNLGRPARAREGSEDADERRASQAVVEGSATLTMLQFAHTVLDRRERLTLRRELLARAREDALEDYTPFLLAELQYPYTEGLSLACARYADGGWEAVDAGYTDPPDSSLAVLVPEGPPGGEEPATPPDLRRPGEGWRQVAADAFGAADLLWLLQAPGGDAEAAVAGARERVVGWQGGRLVAWADGERTVVGLSLAQRQGAPSLCDAVLDWQAAGWDADAQRVAGGAHVFTEPGRVVVASCDGDGVRLAIAPGRAEALATAGG